MSSLLQHRGQVSRTKGVELLMYVQHEERVYKDSENQWPADGLWGDYCSLMTHKVDSEPVKLSRRDGSIMVVPKLYRVWRKPVGMFGCWVVFRYNNAKHVPDLSVPIGVDRLPRDAKPLSDDEAAEYWQS